MRRKKAASHQPSVEIQNLYRALKDYEKATINDPVLAAEVSKALEKRWPALKNLTIAPTASLSWLLLIAGIGIVVGALLVLVIMTW